MLEEESFSTPEECAKFSSGIPDPSMLLHAVLGQGGFGKVVSGTCTTHTTTHTCAHYHTPCTPSHMQYLASVMKEDGSGMEQYAIKSFTDMNKQSRNVTLVAEADNFDFHDLPQRYQTNPGYFYGTTYNRLPREVPLTPGCVPACATWCTTGHWRAPYQTHIENHRCMCLIVRRLAPV